MNKILIDEAAVRRFVYATAMVVDIEKLEDWQLELYDKAGADLAEALADAALDKMADNARELGLTYGASVAQIDTSPERVEKSAENKHMPAPAQEPSSLAKAFNDGVLEGALRERERWLKPPQPPAQPLTDEQNRELFAAFVKKNLGDIAVMDGGRYISPKINNYWLVWQEAHGITKGN